MGRRRQRVGRVGQQPERPTWRDEVRQITLDDQPSTDPTGASPTAAARTRRTMKIIVMT